MMCCLFEVLRYAGNITEKEPACFFYRGQFMCFEIASCEDKASFGFSSMLVFRIEREDVSGISLNDLFLGSDLETAFVGNDHAHGRNSLADHIDV